jgi:hypothetical protein
MFFFLRHLSPAHDGRIARISEIAANFFDLCIIVSTDCCEIALLSATEKAQF